MRNLKKFLALVLATLMVVSAAATVSAFDDVAEDNQYAAAIDKLVEYGITNGVDESNFAPDNDVERYQMALFMARALKPGETDWSNGMEIFDDVEGYYGAIAFAYTEGIVTGIGNNLFAPHDGIRYQDALIMALRALGYEVDVTGDPYWLAAYTKASEIGLTKNVAVTKGEKTLTRAETAQVIYNMLKAVPADGGATIEQKNFGVKGIGNYDTFVITATANQSFTGASEKVSDADYVTLQALNEDGTFGDGFYAKFDTLGFDEDVKPDDVIGYSVDLVNYDAKTNKYEKSAPNKAEVYLTTDDNVTVDNNKITVDKKVYWLVDEYTNNTIKNEIIVKTDDGKVTTAILDNVSKLYYNKNGDVVAPDGTVLALMQEVKAANGQTLYKLAKDADKDAFLLYTASELLNVKDVADKYNDFTSVDGYADIDKLTGAVQITLFDDDNDETYDRAITSPIYMSVYNNKDGNKVNIDSKATGLAKSTEGVTYTETLTKGDIFYYTYNKQTKVINVLGTVDKQYGTIDKLNFTDSDSKNHTITISGTTYKFGSTNSAAAFGAVLAETNPGELNKVDCIDNIVKKPALAFVTTANFLDAASRGATVAYYAYNGYIIYAESYDVEESFSLIAIKNMLDIDSDGLIADIYVDGKLVEDATISEVINPSTNKTVKISDLSALMLSKIASQYFDTDNNIYKGIKLEDNTYRLGIALYDGKLNTTAATAPVKENGFGLYTSSLVGSIEFLDGVSSKGDKYTKIRTDADTVFYFIKPGTNGSLKVYTGSADDSVIKLGNGKIYADCFGYADTTDTKGNVIVPKGVAKRVIVYNYSSVEGFGIASTANAIAYIPAKVGMNKYEINTASEFGLDSFYEGTYYKYNDIAVNMSNGNKTTLYSSTKLTAGMAYEIDENGVVIDGTSAIDITKDSRFQHVDVKNGNIITDDRYVYLQSAVNADGVVLPSYLNPVVYNDKVTYIKGQNMNLDKVDVKANADVGAKLLPLDKDGNDVYYATIYFLGSGYRNTIDGTNYNFVKANDLKDGTFVAIFDVKAIATDEPDEPEDPDEPIIANATYTCEGFDKTYAAVFAPDAEGKATGTVTLYEHSVAIGEEVKNLINESWREAAEDTDYTVSIKKLKGDTFEADYQNTDVVANYTNGVLTISGFTVNGKPNVPVELEAATFEITVTFGVAVGNTVKSVAVTYVATVA